MAIELGVWRIDDGVSDVKFARLDEESRLEDILERKIEIASPQWMVIGRQVKTAYDKLIDLLAIDRDGNLVILELKRDKTYRDIVSQVLDYGSWVQGLTTQDIGEIYTRYVESRHQDRLGESIDKAFSRHFDLDEMPEELNESHTLVIVASSLDPSTERIVRYLNEYHEVSINAVFFRVFKDGDREYLSRVWLTDPTIERVVKPGADEWNGEYYVSYNAGYGEGKRSWENAVKYGFVSGGGGPFYSRTLNLLEPGARVWVNVPGKGYVGVGKVVESVVKVDDFMVTDSSGRQTPICQLKEGLNQDLISRTGLDDEHAEYLVRVKWIKTVDLKDAVKEKGFFGNQNTVAKPRVPKWAYTIGRLKQHFGIKD